MDELFLTVSEIGKKYNISRQTLIYYDKIGLFKPSFIDSNGYRCYSVRQIPHLREIHFLKSLGISLQEIKNHFNERNVKKTEDLLESRRRAIDEEMAQLARKRAYLTQRLNLYSEHEQVHQKIGELFIRRFPARSVVFAPFGKKPNKQELHLALWRCWQELEKYEMLMSSGFGTLIPAADLYTDQLFERAGSYIFLPYTEPDIQNVRVLPAGNYACMYKYGMPYEEEHIYKFIEMIKQRGYSIQGDIVDACILDTTFYREGMDKDLCMLQIRIS